MNYRNNGEGKFENITLPAIGRDSDLSYGAVFGDFDQDGYQDLFVTNIGDHKLYKNINGKVFKDVSLSTGIILSGYGTGTSTGDLDNDGDLDIYSAEYINASSTIFYNETNNNLFIKCELTGTISNKDAVGAKLWLYEKVNHKLVGYREVSSGSGYASGNPQVVHFGLHSPSKYELEIYFPASGIKKIIRNIDPGTSLNISEETGLSAYRTLIGRKFNIVVADREVVWEEIKFLFLSLIILTSFLLTRKKLKWKLKINLAMHLAAFVIYFILLSQFIYDGFFLSNIVPVVSAISFLAVVHLVYQKVILSKRISEEKKTTRDKIARDLHDDLASTISSAAIYTDYLRRHSKNGKTMKNLVDKIHNLMLDSLNSVNDIIWIAVTKNDTLGDLRDKIDNLLKDISDSNLIKINSQIDIEKPELTIKEDYKRNIFLIVKEALNNSLKYSECDEITFILEQTGNYVHLELADNGKGFNINNIDGKVAGNGGRGLPNMKARAAIIDADFKIDSSPDRGTKITVDFKMT